MDEVDTYDEQFGSYIYAAFNDNRNVSTLYGNAVGLVDIGGGTNGYLMIAEDGNIIQTKSASGTLGINSAVETLQKELEVAFPENFKSNPPDRNRTLKALKIGKYVGGGRSLECEPQVQSALTQLMNEVSSMYMKALDGGVGLDVLLMTGGGPIFLEQRMRKVLDFGDMRLASWASG